MAERSGTGGGAGGTNGPVGPPRWEPTQHAGEGDAIRRYLTDGEGAHREQVDRRAYEILAAQGPMRSAPEAVAVALRLARLMALREGLIGPL